MRMKHRYIIIGVICLFLCACGTEDEVHNGNNSETPIPILTQAVEATTIPTAPPTETPKITPTPTDEQLAEGYITSLNRIGLAELEGYVDKEESIRNSNLLNLGFLTYDNEGKIYYRNNNDKNLYVCGYKGEDKRLICESSIAYKWLQLADEWLYCSDAQGGISRVHLGTGEIEEIAEEKSGMFLVDGEKLYFENSDNGFGTMDLEGNNTEKLQDSGGYLGMFVTGAGYWLGNMPGPTRKTEERHFLVKFNENKMELLDTRGLYPLLAGRYLSLISDKTGTRHIWDLKTKKEVDLNVDTEKAAVSDGTDFYYWSGRGYGEDFDWFKNKTDIYCTISKWDGTTAEELIKIDGAFQLYHMFLTPEMLYYQPDFWVDEKQITQLWYYDLETGETGQIY